MKIGVLGGGQLSLMLAEAARPLGMEIIFIDPAADACASQAATQIQAAYDDPAALATLAAQVDVVTYEFENVPDASVRSLSQNIAVLPAVNALTIAQDRLLEKKRLRELDIPVTRFCAITDELDLKQAIKTIGVPAVLKTRRFGYDGKGQVVIRAADEIYRAWQTIGQAPAILEAWVPFDREVSIIAVRDAEGNRRVYPLSENTHENGILYSSFSRADDAVLATADRFSKKLMDALDYVGVLTLELFQLGDELYANEFAPRVHNSGHWTIEGAACSQFENHVRAVAGLPLGDTRLRLNAAMLNCIGEMPEVAAMQQLPGVAVHRYGKAPRAGRKVGHITVTAENETQLARLFDQVRQQLSLVA